MRPHCNGACVSPGKQRIESGHRNCSKARGCPSRDSNLSAADYSTSEGFRASTTNFFVGFLTISGHIWTQWKNIKEWRVDLHCMKQMVMLAKRSAAKAFGASSCSLSKADSIIEVSRLHK